MKRRKKNPLVITLRYLVLLVGVFALGYLVFYLVNSSNKEKTAQQTSATAIWTRLKKRLFDQDLPVRSHHFQPTTDMNDISTHSPSPGLNPTHIIEEEQEHYSRDDKNRLDSILEGND